MKKETPDKTMLSIIIPAHNEEQYIRACLESIKNQKYKDYEIIVVCDACTDIVNCVDQSRIDAIHDLENCAKRKQNSAILNKTAQIAKGWTKKVYTINKKNVSAARNYGAKKAKGDILVFLDADSVIAPNLLFEIDHAIKKECIGGVTKTYSLEHLWKAQLLWAVGNFFRHFFLAGSGMLFCKRELFPGFDETRRLAEDTHVLLALKKKGKLKYITNSFIKTSSRRWEREGYFRTIYHQFSAFFVNNGKGY